MISLAILAIGFALIAPACALLDGEPLPQALIGQLREPIVRAARAKP